VYINVCVLGPADINNQFNLREQLVLLVSSTVGDSVSDLPGDAATAAIVFVSVKQPELWEDDPETRLAVFSHGIRLHVHEVAAQGPYVGSGNRSCCQVIRPLREGQGQADCQLCKVPLPIVCSFFA
jgi:hypothetical protein